MKDLIDRQELIHQLEIERARTEGQRDAAVDIDKYFLLGAAEMLDDVISIVLDMPKEDIVAQSEDFIAQLAKYKHRKAMFEEVAEHLRAATKLMEAQDDREG